MRTKEAAFAPEDQPAWSSALCLPVTFTKAWKLKSENPYQTIIFFQKLIIKYLAQLILRIWFPEASIIC